MPSKSKHQQRFFGMVHHCQKTGDCASPEVKKVAKEISYKDADEFASTKHKGLPALVHHDKKEHLSSFAAYMAFREAQEQCKCGCESCKSGNCGKCSCTDCNCSGCSCH